MLDSELRYALHESLRNDKRGLGLGAPENERELLANIPGRKVSRPSRVFSESLVARLMAVGIVVVARLV